MLNQSIKIGLRRFKKFKVYSSINIGGLAIAMAVCLIILAYTSYHYSFDKYLQNGENSYRIASKVGDGTFRPTTFAAFDDVLPNCPEVESYTVCYNIHNIEDVFVGNNKIGINEAIFIKESFLDYFSIDMIDGNRESINQPNTVFVTPTMAKKLYPESDAIGQPVQLRSFTANQDSLITFTIAGIVQPLPGNSHIGYELLLSQKGHFGPTVEIVKNLKVFSATGYIKTFSNINITELEKSIVAKLNPNLNKSHGPALKDFNHYLQPIYDIHTSTKISHEIRPTVRRLSLNILLLVGVLIFAIATVNFVNMHVAREAFHYKELKIVKFLGGKVKHFFGQMFVEVALSVTISFILAFILIQLFKSSSSQSIINLKITERTGGFWVTSSALYFAVIVIVSGICFFNISKKASSMGKNKKQAKILPAVPLVVFQFVLVIGLICFTMLMNKQMNFVSKKDLGYSSENVIAIRVPQVNNKVNVLREELLNSSSILSAATVQQYPWYRFQDMNFTNGANSFAFKYGHIDKYATNTLKIKPIKYFNTKNENSQKGWLINQTFYNKLKEYYSEEQIANSDFPMELNQSEGNSHEKFTILGVIGDFHYSSLHSAIDNFAFYVRDPETQFNRFVIARYNQTQKQQVLRTVEQKMAEIYPGQPVNYSFLNDHLNEQYESEKSLLTLINLFSVLAIIVASFGLIGLSIFMTQKRTKEIGVRKVNGAKIHQVIYSLNMDYIKLVLISFAIATPIAWFSMSKWLENFAYKTSLSWWIFVLAGLIAVCIALVTVSWQSWLAASKNPVEVLRCE